MRKILCALLTVFFLAVGVNAAFENVNTYNNNFSDVSDSNWFSANVKTAYELGFMNGKSEGRFDPNGNVTVAEGITMASRVHAIFNGTEVKKNDKKVQEYLINFDDPSILDDGTIRLNHANGEIKDGMLVMQPDVPNHNGMYDPGLFVNNLNLNSREYDQIVVRMKREILPNVDPNAKRHEAGELFFQTSNDIALSGDRMVAVPFYKSGADALDDWKEYVVDLRSHDLWRDNITCIRFDPTNNNGIYYIDYIGLRKSENTEYDKWYDMYIEYAKDNGIIGEKTFDSLEYERNITRGEIVNLFASALPESYFGAINNINAVPDMDKNEEYADIVLMMYKAGVVLGDTEGNFNASSDIKRSEIAAIINRVALPEARVKGEINKDWDGMYYHHDLEFNDPEELKKLETPNNNAEIKDGTLILKPIAKEQGLPVYDPKVANMNTLIRADEYPILKVRMKMEHLETPENMTGEFFFLPEGAENFSEENALHPDFGSNYVEDAAGWRVYTFNCMDNENWKGNITAFRFDPTNFNGVFTIDYIRFIRNENTMIVSDAELERNYTSRTIFDDITYENGFYVRKPADDRGVIGKWQYNEGSDEPLYYLCPWWTESDFILSGEDKYTLKDSNGSKVVTYNPEEKSITMTLDATKVFEGEPYMKGQMWPHILVETDPTDSDYSKLTYEEKVRYDAGADKIYAEMDVRVLSYEDFDQANKNVEGGASALQFLTYFYFAHKEIPGLHSYFCLLNYDNRGQLLNDIGWHKDSQSVQMIYNIPMDEIYGSEENAIYQRDGSLPIGEWKHIRIDITPHVENLVNLLNKEDTLKRTVTRDDLWISGMNIGFEIWGNYKSTFEYKNVQIICYDKK